MTSRRIAMIGSLMLLLLTGCGGKKLRVGAKLFPESATLAEMAKHLAIQQGMKADAKQFSASLLVWQALKSGEIDIYPDYTGTLRFETLNGIKDIEAYLNENGLKMSGSLGFNNSYALGMLRKKAEEKKITKISDLRNHPDLEYGISREFRDRADGWSRLRARYGLSDKNVTGFEHLIAYDALKSGNIDVMDVYTTDGKIAKYDILVLEDDLKFFPDYEAVWVYRPDKIPPEVLNAILQLEGKISAERMRELNRGVSDGNLTSAQAAVQFLNTELGMNLTPLEDTFVSNMIKWTLQHLLLVGVSLSFAVMVAIPLGIVAAKIRSLEQPILLIVGIIQTIPALAILSFLLPVFGVGPVPAMIALFLYSLLPIVRNTHAGLKEIPGSLKESAMALGLPSGAILWQVELPLASRAILAGIKISAVLNVGFATLGQLIGAGGYGEPIFTGLSLNNIPMVMQGAVAASVMALVVQGIFELIERFLSPKGLRIQSGSS